MAGLNPLECRDNYIAASSYMKFGTVTVDGWGVTFGTARRGLGAVVEYRTRNREVAGSTHTWSAASNLEQVANLLCVQANSASYRQRDGK